MDANPSPVMAGFSVPKKKFKLSVDRHRIRRLMVESWRLNKHLLYPTLPENRQMHLFIIFTGKEMPDYTTVLAAIIKGIGKLNIALPADFPLENKVIDLKSGDKEIPVL